MKNQCDILNKEQILNLLKDDFAVEVLQTIDSTNNYLKKRAKDGLKTPTVVVSEYQTSGRGRYDRTFHSPGGNGIYMSLLCFPVLPAEKSVLITVACAVAVAKAIEKCCGKTPNIKWVNDLILENRKICGILVESSVNPQNACLDWAVVGIGINVYEPENGFNEEIKNIAGYIEKEKRENLRNSIIAETVNFLSEYLNNLESKTFLEDYKKLSLVINKEITVMKSTPIKATALSIDDNCRLLVKYPDNSLEYLSSGEISIKL